MSTSTNPSVCPLPADRRAALLTRLRQKQQNLTSNAQTASQAAAAAQKQPTHAPLKLSLDTALEDAEAESEVPYTFRVPADSPVLRAAVAPSASDDSSDEEDSETDEEEDETSASSEQLTDAVLSGISHKTSQSSESAPPPFTLSGAPAPGYSSFYPFGGTSVSSPANTASTSFMPYQLSTLSLSDDQAPYRLPGSYSSPSPIYSPHLSPEQPPQSPSSSPIPNVSQGYSLVPVCPMRRTDLLVQCGEGVTIRTLCPLCESGGARVPIGLHPDDSPVGDEVRHYSQHPATNSHHQYSASHSFSTATSLSLAREAGVHESLLMESARSTSNHSTSADSTSSARSSFSLPHTTRRTSISSCVTPRSTSYAHPSSSPRTTAFGLQEEKRPSFIRASSTPSYHPSLTGAAMEEMKLPPSFPSRKPADQENDWYDHV